MITTFCSCYTAGLNVLGFESEDLAVDYDMAEGGALSHNNDIIDIYSNSWGPMTMVIWLRALAYWPKWLWKWGLRK